MARGLAHFFDIPFDAVSNTSRMTVVDGRSILAENCGDISEYTEDCIRFGTGLTVKGAELSIDMMRQGEVLISGLVTSIEWE